MNIYVLFIYRAEQNSSQILTLLDTTLKNQVSKQMGSKEESKQEVTEQLKEVSSVYLTN